MFCTVASLIPDILLKFWSRNLNTSFKSLAQEVLRQPNKLVKMPDDCCVAAGTSVSHLDALTRLDEFLTTNERKIQPNVPQEKIDAHQRSRRTTWTKQRQDTYQTAKLSSSESFSIDEHASTATAGKLRKWVSNNSSSNTAGIALTVISDIDTDTDESSIDDP